MRGDSRRSAPTMGSSSIHSSSFGVLPALDETMPDSALIRKRKRSEKESTAPPSSENSSSSDDEDEGETSSSQNDAQPEGTLHRRDSSSFIHAPEDSADKHSDEKDSAPSSARANSLKEGWRVKLYRLNTDGSWDDCGTGRIICAYRNTAHHEGTHANKDEHGNTTTLDQWLHQETGDATLIVTAEPVKGTAAAATNASNDKTAQRLLLRTRILLRDAYQRQGDNIITWCEPCFAPFARNNNSKAHGHSTNAATSNNSQASNGVDLALSFQDNEGCLDIWHQIQQVQSRAALMIQTRSVQDLAAHVAAQHHADLCQKQERDMLLWNSNRNNNSNGAAAINNNTNHNNTHLENSQGESSLARDSMDSDNSMSGVSSGIMMQTPWSTAANSDAASCLVPSLPQPPTLENLEDVADAIAALQHVQQRENLAMFIAHDECAYLRELLELFPSAESRHDYGKLATLAACVKTILLLNEPAILELVVTVATLFEQVCSCLEYDPDLREKANHRWFLRERARFRTVVPMEDSDLVGAIHRSFRVSYLKDTLLRPTMDESSLSTLTSLQTFTHADVVKGVTMAPGTDLEVGSLYDSYLVRVIDLLCVELHAISAMEWARLESRENDVEPEKSRFTIDPSIVFDKHGIGASHTKQYLAPQDGSLASRKMRRHGCLMFLKELFTMVRMSLQQSDKDDFFSVICTLEIDLNEGRELADNVSQTSQQAEVGSVASTVRSDRLDDKPDQTVNIDIQSIPPPTNLLSMLGNVLADPGTEASEKCAVLDILAGVTMHDPSLIRRHCLDFHVSRLSRRREKPENVHEISYRPEPNERNQVLYICTPDDLLMALLLTMSIERDAGMLLQVSEILRVVLDTDMMNDHGPVNAGFGDEADELPAVHASPSIQQIHPNSQHSGFTAAPASCNGIDEKQFLSVFYENYAEWLVAQFPFQILLPIHPVPSVVILDPSQSEVMQEEILIPFRKGLHVGAAYVTTVTACSIRCSFAVELLSFCVRAHTYRMKFFLLRSKVIGSILRLLQSDQSSGIPSSRALKVAVLRFFRAIISANDEFYHRHIVQNDLFASVFDALRMNPVGDNLLSSAIVEMCDYIHSENIKSLIDYIVTNYLNDDKGYGQRLEDVAGPYVSTLSILRKTYEARLNALRKPDTQHRDSPVTEVVEQPPSPRHNYGVRQLTGKALEAQRKFQELDEEESYFDSDDVVAQSHRRRDHGSRFTDGEGELHRTPRMFSLAQEPLPLPSGGDSVHSLDNMSGSTSPIVHREEDDSTGQSPPTI